MEVALLLGLGGFKQLCQAGAAEHPVAGRVKPGAMLAGFNGNQGSGNQIDFRPAELRWDVEAIEAHVAGFLRQALPIRFRQLVGIRIQGQLQRQDLLAHEPPDHAGDHLLLFGQRQVHVTAG